MKMDLQGNTLLIADADKVQFSVIKSWNMMHWDKSKQVLRGAATLELLDRLSDLVALPRGGGVNPKTGKPFPDIEAYRQRLRTVRDAVDRERMNQKPEPLYNYPVKVPLYAHQVRACNMCLLTFGWVEPTVSP